MTGKVPTRLVILSFAVSLLILVFDVSVPLGVAGGVPYVALVILGIWFPERRYVFILAFIGTALAIVGYFVSPEGGVQWVVLVNRGLAVFAIWVTAFLISYLKRKESALRASEHMLAEAQHIADIGSWTWDLATGQLQWSDEHYRIFGVEPVGRPISI
jgi:PAS domain-containing protein